MSLLPETNAEEWVRGLAERVREARRRAGLTQRELAHRVGTTQSAIARLESGSVAPTVATLTRLADALGIRFEILPGTGLRAHTGVSVPTLAELRARREEILTIAGRYGVRRLRVFGSVARGEAGPESDVDLLVAEPGRGVLDLSGLILDLKDALGRPVTVVEEGVPLAERVQEEAVAL